MSAKGKCRKSRKRYSDWTLTYTDGRILMDGQYRVIPDAVARRHADGGWTFTDKKGLVAGYAPGVLAAVQRDMTLHLELPEPADEPADSRA